MRRNVFIAIAAFLLTNIPLAHAQSSAGIPQETHMKARVEEITDEGTLTANGIILPYQTVRVTLLDGNLKGTSVTIDHGKTYGVDKSQFVRPGQTVVVVQSIGSDAALTYHIIDVYRLDAVLPFLWTFIALVVLLSQWRGVGSIAGMAVSLLVIAKYIVPTILAGGDPLRTSILGCFAIMVTTIYLAHGCSRQTTIALAATFLTLCLTGIISTLFVHASGMTGLGSDDAYSLKLGPMAAVNFRGLLLGGILIGALGVLDDVTTGLTAAVFELARANPNLTFFHLASAGLRVGREHVASLVNTLVLAYAGASLPIFITIITNPNHYPLWSIANSEMIVEEVIRTLSGSFGLVIAVPLTTILAAWQVKRVTASARVGR